MSGTQTPSFATKRHMSRHSALASPLSFTGSSYMKGTRGNIVSPTNRACSAKHWAMVKPQLQSPPSDFEL